MVATLGTYDIAMELGKKVISQRCPYSLSSCLLLLEFIFLKLKCLILEIMKLINGPCQKFCFFADMHIVCKRASKIKGIRQLHPLP